MSIIYRECRKEDAQSGVEFFTKIANETYFTNQKLEHLPKEDVLKEVWDKSLQSKDTFYLGAFDNGELIGQIAFKLNRSDHTWLKHTATFGMIIVKDYWGQGIGQVLLGHLFEFCEKRSVKRIEATVRTENLRGVDFYKKQGFVIEGTKKFTAKINDQWKDEYIIAKYY